MNQQANDHDTRRLIPLTQLQVKDKANCSAETCFTALGNILPQVNWKMDRNVQFIPQCGHSVFFWINWPSGWQQMVLKKITISWFYRLNAIPTTQQLTVITKEVKYKLHTANTHTCL